MSDDFIDGDTRLIRHESQHRENDQPCKHTGATVDKGNNHGISVTVVVEFVEAGHCDQTSPRHSHWVENLNSCISPHLRQSKEYICLMEDLIYIFLPSQALWDSVLQCDINWSHTPWMSQFKSYCDTTYFFTEKLIKIFYENTTISCFSKIYEKN